MTKKHKIIGKPFCVSLIVVKKRINNYDFINKTI